MLCEFLGFSWRLSFFCVFVSPRDTDANRNVSRNEDICCYLGEWIQRVNIYKYTVILLSYNSTFGIP